MWRKRCGLQVRQYTCTPCLRTKVSCDNTTNAQRLINKVSENLELAVLCHSVMLPKEPRSRTFPSVQHPMIILSSFVDFTVFSIPSSDQVSASIQTQTIAKTKLCELSAPYVSRRNTQQIAAAVTRLSPAGVFSSTILSVFTNRDRLDNDKVSTQSENQNNTTESAQSRQEYFTKESSRLR